MATLLLRSAGASKCRARQLPRARPNCSGTSTSYVRSLSGGIFPESLPTSSWSNQFRYQARLAIDSEARSHLGSASPLLHCLTHHLDRRYSTTEAFLHLYLYLYLYLYPFSASSWPRHLIPYRILPRVAQTPGHPPARPFATMPAFSVSTLPHAVQIDQKKKR